MDDGSVTRRSRPSTRPRPDGDATARDATRRPRPSPQARPVDASRRRDDPNVSRRRAPRADSSWLDEVETTGPGRTGSARPSRTGSARPSRTGSARPSRTGSARPSRTGPRRAASGRPGATTRLALGGGVALPSRIGLRPGLPLPDFSSARARRLRLLGPLLVLAAIAIGIASHVGAFSSKTIPTLPAIPARSIATQQGVPATVSLNTTFGGSKTPTGKLSTLELDLARGFHFDPRAAVPCPAAQAQTGACPSDSAIGGGDGEIVVQGRYLPQTNYSVSAAMYLTAPTHRGDIAGLVLDLTQAQSQLHAVIRGRVVPLPTSPYSIVLRFAHASKALSSNYDLNLQRLALRLQASRTISSHTYDLVTNSTPCTRRGWPLQLSITSAKNAWIYHGAASCEAHSTAAAGQSGASSTAAPTATS